MKIFLLKRTDSIGWDEYDAKVVVAKNENKARELANQNTGDEGGLWTNKQVVTCEQIIPSCERVVLESFNAG